MGEIDILRCIGVGLEVVESVAGVGVSFCGWSRSRSNGVGVGQIVLESESESFQKLTDSASLL